MAHEDGTGADDIAQAVHQSTRLYAGGGNAAQEGANRLRDEAEKKLTDLRRQHQGMMLHPMKLRTALNGIIAYGKILTTDAATLQTGGRSRRWGRSSMSRANG